MIYIQELLIRIDKCVLIDEICTLFYGQVVYKRGKKNCERLTRCRQQKELYSKGVLALFYHGQVRDMFLLFKQ